MDGWMDKIDILYTVEYYLVIKKKILLFAATWVDLGVIIFEVRKRKANNIFYVEPKVWHNSTYLWNKNRLNRYREQTCGCQGEEVGW